jgi:hypothetical protein
MTVWAVFLCVASINQCRPADPGYTTIQGYAAGGTTYSSLAACQRTIPRNFHPSGMKLVCLSHHVDIWH